MSLSAQLKPFFDEVSRKRGERYYASGHVRSVHRDGDRVLASVRGSLDRRYTVTIAITDPAVIQASCECLWYEKGNACKHIWAAVRAADAQALLGAAEVYDFDLLDFDEDFEDDDDDDWETGESEPSRRASARWKSVLSSIPRKSSSAAREFHPPEQVFYAIEQWGRRIDPHGVRLVVLAKFRKKNGELGKLRDLRVSIPDLDKLAPEDQEILKLLNLQGYSSSSLESRYTLRPMAASRILAPLGRAGRLYLRPAEDPELRPIVWEDEPWRANVDVAGDPAAEGWRLEATLRRDGERIGLDAVSGVFPDLILIDNRLAPLADSSERLPWLHAIADSGPVTIPKRDRDAFIDQLARTGLDLELPEELSWVVEEVDPKPALRLTRMAHTSELHGEVSIRYGEREVHWAALGGPRQWMDGNRLIQRDASREERLMAGIHALPVIAHHSGGFRIRQPVMGQVIGRLVELGWDIEIDGAPLQTADSFEMSVESGIDWFDLHGSARFGSASVSMPALLEALATRQSVVRLEDGSFGILPMEALAGLALPAALGKVQGDALRFRKNQGLLLDALLGARAELRKDEAFERLRRLKTAAPQPLREANTFSGTLRPYQREGLGWIEVLREAGLAGCLADDMGLGKTVQVLAMLDRLPRAERAPALIVVPKSLLYNWRREAERFTPAFRVLEYHGVERKIEAEEIGSYDLVLTTYGTLRKDVVELSGIEFGWVILDEAQSIKNAGSQVAKASRLLGGRNRLALSGTPIENHLGELWSLFEFLNPGMLGPARAFQSRFTAKTAPPENRKLLAKALRPFILRRTKEQVAPELPSRTEQTLACELSPAQRKEYDTLRDFYRATLLKTIDEQGLAKSKMHVLEALLRLRQTACHPGLVSGDGDAPSAKLDLLMEELGEVLEGGHKAIVFSQFTSLLAYVRERLDREGIAYSYLDGQTRDRESVVGQFQSPSGPPLFLVSLKAGGVGLNLTSADYVFLLDPWWNPAVEAQAIDRAHRIGQTRPVIAYRLIAKDTVEERIVELQERKRELAGAIVSDENALLRKLELEDLEALLS